MSWPQTSLEAVATARSHDDPPPRDFESIELSCDAVNSLIHFVICCLFDLGFRNFGLLCHGLKPSSRLSRPLEATMYDPPLIRSYIFTELRNLYIKDIDIFSPRFDPSAFQGPLPKKYVPKS